jgi:hypothetical protein
VIHRALLGLLWAVGFYLFGAVGGGFLTHALSSNRHDRYLEAVITGAFFLGPAAAILGFVIGAARAKAPPAGRRN